ncbi:sensor histidine kinase [Actinomadura fibrosa]|uniref:histidine kinase n=1 Tax=Actinomadura fibrosa TaxID=111802 RepID=A0ABW2XJN7_9ACTN|nr:sensor histidine kinase [Actinomadura fibrosa]
MNNDLVVKRPAGIGRTFGRLEGLPLSWWLRMLVFGALAVWGSTSYVRGLFDNTPRPALHGAGLALVLLNGVMLGSLVAALVLKGRKEARWRRTVVALLVTAMAAALALYGISPRSGSGFFFALPALWVLVRRLPLPWGLGLGALGAAVTGVVGEIVRQGGADLGLMAAVAGLTVGAVAGRQADAAREATRRAEAAGAVLAERSRIAREIHDILAHSLSAQLVHLEGARLLLARDGDRVQALDRVERARNLARTGLEETKRALATLRGEIPEPKDVLAELADEFYVGTGRPCDVQVTGEPRELSPQAGLAVVRTAQEALTNVRKHAPGARAHVTLRYLDDEVELEVTDTGGAERPMDLETGGYGLVGMRERAELIDGILETGQQGEGFRVFLRVPA